MKKDIKILLEFLEKYQLTFSHSEIYLMSQEEDEVMHKKIENIKNKYNK
jgi:hypothetical protein